MGESNKKHCWIEYIALVISAIAVIVAFMSYRTAKKANIAANRPYLNIRPIRYEETDAYFKTSIENDTVWINIQHEIRNVGRTISKKITLPDEYLIGIIGLQPPKTPPTITLPPVVDLGPDEKIKATLRQRIACIPPAGSLEELMELIKSDDISFSVQLVLYYYSEIEDSPRFSSIVKHEISYNKAIVQRIEYG